MEIFDIEELKHKIVQTENLRPGDKVSYEQLKILSHKFNINIKLLAINIFGVTQCGYEGLCSKHSNSKNIIIF